MMKVMAFNGSPRKKWNTASLLKKAIEGAASQGAETSLVHLYDLHFYGTCAVQDDLTPIYAEIKKANAIILGSPIYFGDVTGELRSFLERLLFPYLVYDAPPQTLFPRKIRTAWIYTMNAPEEIARQFGYDQLFNRNELVMRMIFGHSESIMSYDTYQFEDYSKVVANRFDVDKKKKRRREVFPKDCQKAYDLGAALAKKPD
jgi:multimeric flavodoxin WrbA